MIYSDQLFLDEKRLTILKQKETELVQLNLQIQNKLQYYYTLQTEIDNNGKKLKAGKNCSGNENHQF